MGEPALAFGGKHRALPAQLSRISPTAEKKSRAVSIEPPTATHQRWQIDFKVGICLAGQQTVQLHDVYDPFSGGHLDTQLYPSAPGARRVGDSEVRATVRHCCTLWRTCPDEIQTDGEPSLVGKAGDDFPTLFTLWLTGLGIVHRVISPGKPTQNGGVERDHRTTYNYGVAGHTHLDLARLQIHLDQANADLNTYYPSRAKGCQGLPPLQAHPELLSPRHPYHPDLEASLFDLRRVDAYLASLSFQRRVSKTGQITLGGQHCYYFLHRQYASQIVTIRFDPADRSFVASLPDAQGQFQELKRWPARNLSAEDILGPLPAPTIPVPLQLPLPFLALDPVPR